MQTIGYQPQHVNGCPPTEIVRQNSHGRWDEILPTIEPALSAAVGASPSRHVSCPFQTHDDVNPSFRIDDISIGSAICNCGQWANGFLLLRDLNGWSEQEAVAAVHIALRRLGPPFPKPDPPGSPTPAERQQTALSIWTATQSDDGTIARYLLGRGLSEWVPATIRLHTSSQVSTDTGPVNFPAAVCAVQQADGTQSGIQRIYVDPQTGGIAQIAEPKRALGIIKGGAVRLCDPQANYIHLCEGVETGLAIAEAFGGAPVWACLTANGLRSSNIPDSIRQAVIWADNDASGEGQRAASDLAQRLHNEGRNVWVLTPPTAGEDWLDVFCRDRQALPQALQSAQQWQPDAETNAENVSNERFPTMTAAEFDAADFSVNYWIQSVLVEREFCVVGAPDKTLKTTICGIELLLCLATGQPFLNHFSVNRTAKVCLLSGESGGGTLQDTARRVARSKGFALASVPNWHISTEIPQLKNASDVRALEQKILQDGLDVVAIDPAYLAMDISSGESANKFEMGAVLRPLLEIMKRTGCTIILIHHFRASAARNFAPPDLSDLSHAGFSSIARQWILLSRRRPYEDDGHHSLWLRCGGSAGHSSLWGLAINEGRQDDPGGRKWDVHVLSAADARSLDEQAKEICKVQNQSARSQHKLESDVFKLTEAMTRFPKGETERFIRQASGLNSTSFARALSEAGQRGLIEKAPVKKSNNQTYEGIRLKPSHWGIGTVPVAQSAVPVQAHSGTGGLIEAPVPVPL